MSHTCTLRPGWRPLSIGLMVLGFVVFWPLGLAMLAYILWGDQMRTMFRDASEQFRSSDGLRGRGRRFHGTGNIAFDEHRERELNRLEEERRRLEEMRVEFDDFLRNLRRAKDQEEFDRFMADRERHFGD